MAQFRLLAGVPEVDGRRLLAIAKRRRFARGEIVFHRDDPADTLHLVGKGRFAVLMRTPLGQTAMLAVRGPADSFGETALLAARAKRTATVRALEAGETHAVDAQAFAELRNAFPAVDRILFALLAAELRRMNDALVEALYLPVEHRVRRRLLDLVRVYDGGAIPLTQTEVAELAGTTRATANQILRNEENEGVVRLERGRIVVVDPAALERRASRPA